MILVVGATGLVGSEICRLLSENNKPVRALTRSTSDREKVALLQRHGVTIALGDLKDRASLDVACEGVSTVISTASCTLSRQDGDTIQTVDLEGQKRLVDAAKDAGAQHFIFVSFRTEANPDLQYPLKAAKHAVEQHLMESGMAYTILQASYFMEVWLGPALGFDYSNGTAQIYGPGHSPLSWISFLDVAKVSAACVDSPVARNSVIELGGPEALSPLEAVKIFEEVKGESFEVTHVPVDALEGQKAAAPDAVQESFVALMLQYASGDAIEQADILKKMPIQLSTVRDYANRVMAST